MTERLVLRFEPTWDPAWAEIQVSPSYQEDLQAALEAADVDHSRVIKASAGEYMAYLGIYGTATAAMWKALTPALKAFLSRHDKKQIEIKVGDESVTFTGYSAENVSKMLDKAEDLRVKRAERQREINGEAN